MKNPLAPALIFILFVFIAIKILTGVVLTIGAIAKAIHRGLKPVPPMPDYSPIFELPPDEEPIITTKKQKGRSLAQLITEEFAT